MTNMGPGLSPSRIKSVLGGNNCGLLHASVSRAASSSERWACARSFLIKAFDTGGSLSTGRSHASRRDDDARRSASELALRRRRAGQALSVVAKRRSRLDRRQISTMRLLEENSY